MIKVKDCKGIVSIFKDHDIDGRKLYSVTDFWRSIPNSYTEPRALIKCLPEHKKELYGLSKKWGKGFFVNMSGAIYALSKLNLQIILQDGSVVANHVRSGCSVAISTIEQIKGVKLIPEFPVLNYRIDGYDVKNKIAYEIDEPHHFIEGKLRPECIKRQLEIEKYLGCKFVRISI